MKHLGWKPGNIQVLYCVNKINRSYSVVFIAYTKNEMEKNVKLFFGCALFSLCSYESCILIAESIMFVINKILLHIFRSFVL